MLLIWLVGAAFLYWPFKKWEATYKAPILSAFLWPVMVIFFLGLIIWAKFVDRDSNFSKKKKELTPQQAGKILAKKIITFTSTEEEKLALAKQLLIHAKVDFKHEYCYPIELNLDIKQDIDFSIHSRKFLNFYNIQQSEEVAEIKQLESVGYHPWEYSNRHLKKLDLIKITQIFNSMVNNLEDPKDRFKAKLLIIDGML